MGDPNGIGPEVVLKSLADTRIREFVDPVLIGSPSVLQAHVKELGMEPLNIAPVMHPGFTVSENRLKIIDSAPERKHSLELGQIRKYAGEQAFQSVEIAVDLAIEGKVDAVVTSPISKKAIAMAGYSFPGHTEFLVERTGATSHTMMLVSGNLRVGLLTGHMPIAQVANKVTKTEVVQCLKSVASSLESDFGIQCPKIGVLGLNPHAGERGLLGREEIRAIIPGIKESCKSGILAFGPFPADGFFGSRAYRGYDAVLAMYHDQGLIPFKTMAFNMGVNFTAGLPIVRTSPDHGTAFDIAGKNKADESSMRQALFTAVDIVRQRKDMGQTIE